MNNLTFAAMGIVMGYAAFHRAGVEVSVWNSCLVAVGCIGCLHFILSPAVSLPSLDWTVGISAAFILALAGFQLLPLSVGIVSSLSPMRAELLKAVSLLTGQDQKTLPLSAVPWETAEYALTIAGYLMVFLTIRDASLRCRNRLWLAAWPLLAIASLEALLGVYQVSSGASEFSAGTYDNRDHLAGLLEMVLPFAAVYPAVILWRDKDRRDEPTAPALRASFVMGLAFLIFAATVYTVSRMGFLASLAALFVAAANALAARDWNLEYETSKPLWRRLLPWASVCSAIVVGFFILPSDLLARRFADLAATDDISQDTRSQIWRDSAGLIRDYPLFGCGLGGYQSCFLRYKSVAPMSTVDYAHNDYLQVMAEFGILGLLAGLAFIARITYRVILGSLFARSIDERYLAVACVASIVAILLHSLVDFNMYVPANGLAFAWIAGIGSAFANHQAHQQIGSVSNVVNAR